MTDTNGGSKTMTKNPTAARATTTRVRPRANRRPAAIGSTERVATTTSVDPQAGLTFWAECIWRSAGDWNTPPLDTDWFQTIVVGIAEILDLVGMAWVPLVRPWIVFDAVDALADAATPSAVARYLREHCNDVGLGYMEIAFKRGLDIVRAWYPDGSTTMPPTDGGSEGIPVTGQHGFLLWIGAIADMIEEDLPGATNALLRQQEWAENAYRAGFAPDEIAQYIIMRII